MGLSCHELGDLLSYLQLLFRANRVSRSYNNKESGHSGNVFYCSGFTVRAGQGMRVIQPTKMRMKLTKTNCFWGEIVDIATTLFLFPILYSGIYIYISNQHRGFVWILDTSFNSIHWLNCHVWNIHHVQSPTWTILMVRKLTSQKICVEVSPRYG